MTQLRTHKNTTDIRKIIETFGELPEVGVAAGTCASMYNAEGSSFTCPTGTQFARSKAHTAIEARTERVYAFCARTH